MYSIEIPKTRGKFYVSFNDKLMGGKFFETVKEALDFYADKLKEKKSKKMEQKLSMKRKPAHNTCTYAHQKTFSHPSN